MSTPPSWFLKEMDVFLHLRTVESAVLKLRPEFAGHVREPEAGRPLLSFELGDNQRVVVALIDAGASGRSWMITDSRTGSEAALFPRAIDAQQLAQTAIDWIDSLSPRTS